ncbi:Uncharacterized protein SCF082_LOCUS5970, partial [Durusdinium trenchii]
AAAASKGKEKGRGAARRPGHAAQQARGDTAPSLNSPYVILVTSFSSGEVLPVQQRWDRVGSGRCSCRSVAPAAADLERATGVGATGCWAAGESGWGDAGPARTDGDGLGARRRMSGANETLCTTDYDCDVNEICYADVDWFSVEEFPGTGYSLAFGGLNALTCFAGLLTTTILILCARFLQKHGKEGARLCSFDATALTLLTSLVSAANATLWALTATLSTLDTTSDPLVDPQLYKDLYKGKYNVLGMVAAPLAAFCCGVAMLAISLMWIELSLNSGRLTPNARNRLNRSRWVIWFFMALTIVLATAGAFVERTSQKSTMGYFLLPVTLFVAFTYIVGAYKLNSIIKASAQQRARYILTPVPSKSSIDTSDNPSRSSGAFERSRTRSSLAPMANPVVSMRQLRRGKSNAEDALGEAVVATAPFFRALRRIRNTSLGVGFCIALFGGSYLGLAVIDSMGGWRELSQPGTFSLPKLMHSMLTISIVLANMVIASYILQSLKNSPNRR